MKPGSWIGTNHTAANRQRAAAKTTLETILKFFPKAKPKAKGSYRSRYRRTRFEAGGFGCFRASDDRGDSDEGWLRNCSDLGVTVHGFPGYGMDEPIPTLREVLDGAKPANSAPIRVDIAPGSQLRYSGGGYCILQQLLIDLSKKSFPQVMQERVLAKIGMSHSTYEQPLPKELWPRAATGHQPDGKPVKGKWHTYPEMAPAGLWTTPADLALFAIELQNSKAGTSNKVLSKATVDQMLSKQIGSAGLGAGLGLFVGGEGNSATFSHGGANAGFRCSMFAYNEQGKAAVIMTPTMADS